MRTRPKSPSISPPLLIITVYSNSFLAYLFSQLWFPTVQDVLHADWQDVWHSPHPPFFTVLFRVCVFNVLMCFIVISSFFAHYVIQYSTFSSLPSTQKSNLKQMTGGIFPRICCLRHRGFFLMKKYVYCCRRKSSSFLSPFSKSFHKGTYLCFL